MKIGINQMWRGRKVCDLSETERKAMETELSKNGEECVEYEYSEDTSEAFVKKNETPKSEPHRNDCSHQGGTTIRINGHTYNSFEEMIAGEKDSGNVQVISGDDICINGSTIIAGGRRIDIPSDKNVYFLINGNCGSIDSDYGNVTVYGDVNGNVDANCGNVRCNKVNGNAEANCGNITVGKVDGEISATYGIINRL